ncbi:MAG: hypothetical protein M3N21_05650 [Actinomycetota bacterium]|nr:hypothetical protein [Actinomycetota bacterium]
MPLFEHGHGMLCAECGRTVHLGQPYQARLDTIREDGMVWSELLCVYCAFSPLITSPSGDSQP